MQKVTSYYAIYYLRSFIILLVQNTIDHPLFYDSTLAYQDAFIKSSNFVVNWRQSNSGKHINMFF